MVLLVLCSCCSCSSQFPCFCWQSSIEFGCACRQRVQTALAAALQAVQAVRDTYSSMVADVNISTDDLLAEFDGTPLEQYAERLDFYKQQINAVNNNTSTQV